MPDMYRSLAPILQMHSLFGLERENLRIQTDGTLALTPHPSAFGDKLTHPFITTDFSESQIELITPAAASLDELSERFTRQLGTVYRGLGNELLWPLSNLPEAVPSDDAIPIADFGPHGKDKNDYRRYLAKKYGSRRQLYCGIHLNFSFNAQDLAAFLPSQEARNAFYLNCSANAMRFRFFLVYLLAASPELSGGVRYRSIRLGADGYRNLHPVFPDYSSAAHYLNSIRDAVNNGWIEGPRELYQHVRLKGDGFDDLQDAARASRLELRIPDLNPLYANGINPDDLKLIHLYLLWSAALKSDSPFDGVAQQQAGHLADQAAQMVIDDAFADAMNQLFARLEQFANAGAFPLAYDAALAAAKSRWLHPETGYAEKINTKFAEIGKTAAGLAWADEAKQRFIRAAGERVR